MNSERRGKSDMKMGENFVFIDVESFVTVEEGIVVGWVISNEWTFIAQSRVISLTSNNELCMGHVQYVSVAILRAEWKVDFIIALVKFLTNL